MVGSSERRYLRTGAGFRLEEGRLVRIVFPHSHAFRSGRVVVEHDGKIGPGCLVEFGDGITVIAEWRPAGEGIELRVPAYSTAKGNEVASRNWILARRKDGWWRSKLADGGQ
jgi:hypothetical protein